MGAGRVLSSESLSSGYSTDQYLPVDTEILDTEDYELWERRYHSPQPPPHRQRQWRNPVSQVRTFYIHFLEIPESNKKDNLMRECYFPERGGDFL